MHANTYFLKFSLLYENTIWWFFLETWSYAWKQKHLLLLLFLMSWWKPGILILDLYLYNIKIQTDIDQNAVKNLRKITDFLKYFLKNFFLVGPSTTHVAELDPTSLARSLAQASDPTGWEFMHAWICFTRAWTVRR